VFFLPLPVRATFGLDDRLVEKIRKVIGMDVGAENDISAAATVAPVRTASRHEFLAPETDATTPTIAGLGKNFYTIDKHMQGEFRAALMQSAIVRAACHPEVGDRGSAGR
jgi:hypothetical protein